MISLNQNSTETTLLRTLLRRLLGRMEFRQYTGRRSQTRMSQSTSAQSQERDVFKASSSSSLPSRSIDDCLLSLCMWRQMNRQSLWACLDYFLTGDLPKRCSFRSPRVPHDSGRLALKGTYLPSCMETRSPQLLGP